MCYFTITADRSNKEGHTQAIMIIDTENHESAINEWNKTFDLVIGCIDKGVVIPEGFENLLTEHAKKYILKAKVGKKGAPIVSYTNKITLNHEDAE